MDTICIFSGKWYYFKYYLFYIFYALRQRRTRRLNDDNGSFRYGRSLAKKSQEASGYGMQSDGSVYNMEKPQDLNADPDVSSVIMARP